MLPLRGYSYRIYTLERDRRNLWVEASSLWQSRSEAYIVGLKGFEMDKGGVYQIIYLHLQGHETFLRQTGVREIPLIKFVAAGRMWGINRRQGEEWLLN